MQSKETIKEGIGTGNTKTILVNFGNSFFVRNFLRSGVFSALKEYGNIHLVLLAPKEKIEYYRKEFPEKEIVFDVLPETKNFLIERFFKFLETASVHKHTSTMIRRYDFVRSKGSKFLLTRLWLCGVRCVCWQLGRFRWWRKTIRAVYYILPSNTFGLAFAKYNPDLVYCPTMLYHDVRIIKEAKKAGLKTLGMILSWDNLYSKSLIRVYPDRLIAHTSVAKEQAHRLGDYPSDKIFVTGIPQYDRYFRKIDVMPRDEFIRSIGGDPQNKLLVYAVSGKGSLWIDFDILKMIHQAIVAIKIIEPIDVLLRSHPRYDISPKKYETMTKEYHFLARESMTHVGGGKDNWEFDQDKVSLLSNTLAHADIVISMYSTFFIEAAIFDKPLIAIGFDGISKRPYWDSAERFFEWDHLKELRAPGGISIVRSREELIKAINNYLKNPSHLQAERARIVSEQAEFTDGNSSSRVAKIMLESV